MSTIIAVSVAVVKVIDRLTRVVTVVLMVVDALLCTVIVAVAPVVEVSAT